VRVSEEDEPKEGRRGATLAGVDEMMAALAQDLIRDEDQRAGALSMARGLLKTHLAQVAEANENNETEEVAS
jgi:hypothetical protein